ncbi:galactose-specific lectin nattectin-like [Synchiropus picturatus]
MLVDIGSEQFRACCSLLLPCWVDALVEPLLHVPSQAKELDRCRGTFHKKACIRLGGNLASIRGTVENRFVKKMVNRVTCSNQPIWIGGFDSASEGIWLWSDGARFYNYSWAKKVKKNKSEQCLLFHLIGTYWKDQKCEKKFSYVCSMTLK